LNNHYIAGKEVSDAWLSTIMKPTKSPSEKQASSGRKAADYSVEL
jgi:hypothetical protein